jgi:hypothetical protein
MTDPDYHGRSAPALDRLRPRSSSGGAARGRQAILTVTLEQPRVCGPLAARSGRIPREIPARDVQRELLRQGASLRPEIRESLLGSAE